MSDHSNIKEFPNISDKLAAAPAKKSQIERERALAEEKRKRDQEETKRALEEFAKSFDYDEESPPQPSGSARVGGGPPNTKAGLGSGPPKRHFTGNRALSGPGTLGPPPPSRKRPFPGAAPRAAEPASLFQTSDDEDDHTSAPKEEEAVPKPTIRLASLPPGTSQATIKSLIPDNLKVEDIRVLPATASGPTQRRSMTAIATLASETPANDIDAAVNSLQNKYLGWGHYLNISRHLSSTALGSLNQVPNLSLNESHPFGARQMQPAGPSLSRAPPPGTHRGGIAPPGSYAPSSQRQLSSLQVKVHPPSDLTQLRMIHKTVEKVITHGVEFEALLMSRREVQRDEKWAWIWDARSIGGAWYRWRLWQFQTGGTSKQIGYNNMGGAHLLFKDNAPWMAPENPPPFEFITDFEELVSDEEYNSSDDDSDDERKRRFNNSGAPQNDPLNDQKPGKAFLGPLKKAKLTHMLARLPTSTGKLRITDLARITAFAINYSEEGAQEIVEMIVSNVAQPFAWTNANPARKAEKEEPENPDKEKDDPSSSKLIGLHVISDILANAAVSGAWKYRSLFEKSLMKHRIFEKLGRLDKDLKWGRMRAEKWKRSVMNVLQLWEGINTFSTETHEHMRNVIQNPPLSEQEKVEKQVAEKKEKEEKRKEEAVAAAPKKNNWRVAEAEAKPFDPTAEPVPAPAAAATAEVDEDLDGEPMEDLDGEPMDEDIDGEPMDEDFDGMPMDDSDGMPMDEDVQGTPKDEPVIEEAQPRETERQTSTGLEQKVQPPKETSQPQQAEPASIQGNKPLSFGFGMKKSAATASAAETAAAKAKKRRPRAEDMFADSD